jgi:CheY-like chemotaxis protein
MFTVLLAEGAASVRDYIKAILKRDDLVFVEAHDASEALVAVLEGHFDLILLDYELPPMGGRELLRWVRRRNDVPVVVLAPPDRSLEARSLLVQGARDVLAKPLDAWLLVKAVEAALGPEPAYTAAASGGHE